MMFRTTICLVLLVAGCASHDPKEPTSSDRDVNPQPVADVAKASIASVQMIEDCPDAEPAADPPPPPAPPAAAEDEDVAAEAMAVPMRKAAPGAAAPGAPADGFAPMPDSCTQSTMQIAFTGQGDAPARVAIKSIRMLDADGDEVVARIDARRPTAWRPQGGYAAWDQTIAPDSDVKASYSLSVPDWSRVERKLGGKPSMGHMFVLEVEVEVGGTTQRIRSPEFPREEPHVIVT